MPKTGEIKRVKLVCDKHGEIGEMEKIYLGEAQIDHDEIFDCMGPFTIIPVVNAIVETIDEKKSE